MSNVDPAGVVPPPDDSRQLDFPVLNNGVKLVGEALVPGASLLLEKHIAAGVTLGAVGVLGGAAFGSVFGPLGYLLARYGASVLSFSQSMERPTPPATNGAASTAQVVNEVRAMRSDFATVARAFAPAAQAFATAPAFAPAASFSATAAAPSDLSEQIAAALRKVVPEIAEATGDVVARSVRAVIEEERPATRARRPGTPATE